MNPTDSRFFPGMLLTRPEEQPHPAMTALVREVRSSKAIRQLAKSATFQLRYLVDIAAFEHFLNGAATASAEQGVDAGAWLEAKVREIKQEQEIRREEHSRLTARIGLLP